MNQGILALVSSIGCMSAGSLQTLDVSQSKAGTAGMGGLNVLVQALPGLKELAADGFETDNPQAVYALWLTIGAHPGLCACDIPLHDLRHLGLIMHRTPPAFHAAYDALAAKPRPATDGQRDSFVIGLMDASADYSACADIFRLAPEAQDMTTPTAHYEQE